MQRSIGIRARALAFSLMALSLANLSGCGGSNGKASNQPKPSSGKSTSAPATPVVPNEAKPVATPPVSSSSVGAFPEGKATTLLTGVVRLEGAAPERKPIRTDNDPVCQKMHEGAPLLDEVIIAGAGGELANVLVFVSTGLESYTFDAPDDVQVLDQKGCQYVPRVFGVMVGQPIKIRNSDTTIHNVNCQASENLPFNLSQAQKGMETEKVFEDPEMPLTFKCDVHPWMRAYGGVFTHPFFAVSKMDGSFQFPRKLIPGEYTLTAWHEKLGKIEIPVSVKGGDSHKVELRFKNQPK